MAVQHCHQFEQKLLRPDGISLQQHTSRRDHLEVVAAHSNDDVAGWGSSDM
jgi:hypothetical protein